MKFRPPKIYPITDRRISGLTHLEQVKRLVEGGATLIQLREKESNSQEFFDAALEVIEYARKHGASIIINDRVDVTLAAKADGVHLGQDDMSPEKARLLLGDRAIIGYSTHTLDQALNAAALPIDYLAFGPVFATDTKRDAEAVVGLEALRRIHEVTGEIPLVAIGGIKSKDIDAVRAAGADSVAMISGIVGDAAEIAKTFRSLHELSNNV